MPKGKANNNPNYEKLLAEVESALKFGGDDDVAKGKLDTIIGKNIVALLSRAYVLRARIHAKQRSFSEAEEDFTQAITNNHDKDPEIFFDIGCYFISRAQSFNFKAQFHPQYELAAKQFREYLSSNKSRCRPKAQCMLGVAMAGLGDYEQAVQFVNGALNQEKNQKSPLGFSAFALGMQAFYVAKRDSRNITVKEYDEIILKNLDRAIAAEPENEQYKQQKKIISKEREELRTNKRIINADIEVQLEEEFPAAAPAKKPRPEVKPEEKKDARGNLSFMASKPPAIVLHYSPSPSSELDADPTPPAAAEAQKPHLQSEEKKPPPGSPTKVGLGSPKKSFPGSPRMICGFHVTSFSKGDANRLRMFSASRNNQIQLTTSATGNDSQASPDPPTAYQKISESPPTQPTPNGTPALERGDPVMMFKMN